MSTRGRLAVIGILLLGSAGCGGKAYVRKGFEEHPPRRVAVLPFVITYPYDLAAGQTPPEEHLNARDLFRQTFYEALTPYGYDDIPTAEVDAVLTVAWGPLETGAWQRQSPQELGRVLKADALIYGDIARLTHIFNPAYTQTSIDATLRMVEPSSGEELWRQRVDVTERGGAAVQKGQFVDFVQDQVRSFGPAAVKFQRVADTATQKALKDLPNPSLGAETAAAPFVEDPSKLQVAILPLAMESPKWTKAAESLRRGVAANLHEGPFQVLEISRVDAALKQAAAADATAPTQAEYLQLAQMLHADAFLRGTVTTWGRTYLAIESWVKAGMKLELVDANTGKVIWSHQDKNTRHSGLSKIPTGYKAVVTAPIMGMKPSHLNRVALGLTEEMAKTMLEAPEVKAYVNQATQSASVTP